jgi:hypothetical protein
MYQMIKRIIATTVIFLCTFSIFARDVTVIVIDSDLDLPLEGAVIRAWDGREYICDADGKAVIQAPEDRQVVIQAAYHGYETGRIVIPVTGDSFSIGLVLSEILQGRELVVEASRPGSSESRTGRSVAVGEREIAQTGEIGIVEDVMNTIKLLPGVGYTGMFNAQPSIRGGHPGDMSASLDGFYINNPYHWAGGYSIFDPRMVQSAQLSHGVFSSRYGHTISGLLEITAKKPSPTDTQFELGLSTSAASFNLSLPFSGRGGILIMGRITYYDPVIALAKQLSKVIPAIEAVNYITQAPYIRSGTITGNYRFADNLEFAATGFWGMDGGGAHYINSSRTSALNSDSDMELDYTNYQGFITTSLSWNPGTDMLLKTSLGTGYEKSEIDGKMSYNIHNKEFSETFKNSYSDLYLSGFIEDNYQYRNEGIIKQSDSTFNLQGRIDFDWELPEGFMVAAGVQEMFSLYKSSGDQELSDDIWLGYLSEEDQNNIKLIYSFVPSNSNIWDVLRVGAPVAYSPDSKNKLFTTSGYVIGEYNSRGGRFNAELGLRVDHFILVGKGFTAKSDPALNPRVNIDFNILKNVGFLRSFDLSAGTGLFSSINSTIFAAEERYKTNHIKPNRSWTSILGLRFELPALFILNIEGYYKYVFDRTYIPVGIGLDEINVKPYFDGQGRVWGIDIMLQKIQSRFFDGWLSYSYNWAKYRDPGGEFGVMGFSGGNRGGDWYFPSYHRFHYLNLVLNIKPVQSINFYVRLGLASGAPLSRRLGDGPQSYPVLIFNKENPAGSYFIEKYYWPSVLDENNRTTPSLPMDVKFSIYGNNANGKTRYEVYIAVENVLALIYTSQGNTRFNQYTGEIDTGSNSANYEIPIPVPSFGFKISY